MADVVSSRVVHPGRVFSVTVDEVRLPHGRQAMLEIGRHPASVILIPMPDPAHVILVRQYRYAVDRFLWELPAGSIDPGEDLESAARRECHEEIGLVPTRAEKIASMFPTPGYCDEEMTFFRLTGLVKPESTAAQDPDEHIEPRSFSLDEVRTMIARGDIVDMKTVAGVTLV
jgi:ADP-ribose pyrophosphatase